MGVDNSIWTTIIMYMIAAVILGILTYLWLTFRLKKNSAMMRFAIKQRQLIKVLIASASIISVNLNCLARIKYASG